MKKYLFILISLFAISVFAQKTPQTKEITAADSVMDVVSNGQWLEIAVVDTGDADSVYVYFPYTDTYITTGTRYGAIGKIMELSTGDEVTGLYGDADMKFYWLWLPYPRAVRFLASEYLTGGVEIKAYNKP